MRITAPDYIQFYPTIRCNLSCDFCFNTNVPFMDDMESSDLQRLINILGDIGVRKIDIIGGEPLMYSHILDFVDIATKSHFSINISTNGTCVEQMLTIMKHYPEVQLGISINNHKQLGLLKDILKSHRPIVKSIFRKEPMWEFIQEIILSGVKKYYLIYPDMITEMESIKIGFYEFYEKTEYLCNTFSIERVYCSGFIPDVSHYPYLKDVRCPAGTTKLGIMPDGSVYPCNLFFGIEDFCLGNILSDNFEKIWESTQLKFFRTYTGNICPVENCKIKPLCHGGCPYHSLIHYGELGMPDPRCFYLTKK